MTSHNSTLPLVTLAFISVVLLVVLVLGAYNIQSKNQKILKLLDLADKVAESRALAQSIRVLQNNAAEDLVIFDSLTLSDDKLVPLIENIEGMSRALGLDTSIVSVSKIEDKKSVEPDIIRIVMETRGSWVQTFSFLSAIESLPHRVMIEELGLSRVEASPAGNGASWRLRIVLSLYSFD
ncbi:MAG: hypothetical protein A2665_00390 [Candidatus Zambryskibacteria bacterium RIFCSPHIGHO2_01_FULL_46_30]|uniref:Uncharacterized protein n=1 Tax=Candidatus Zambryskibacteria bacterium RIFCSPHIGHO2_01_FULL_46_30 TaxID=1802739 RepID=A0A1G2T5Z4_9BACT|nr:MAG: hypothetical protein A2665_00390 [Candidatus Zambryskibacteria bacterium RIFCSPHIGHO2_01_FULL_46_30]OHB05963.1 MAG: hypothetical protein A3B22_01155 [Candidatus Zambryskibacteria bacterium RIFCSPLOWO2_01_FULL_47_33]